MLCSLYVNFEFLSNDKQWYFGTTTLDKLCNFSIHLLSIFLSFIMIGIEVEWVQLLDVVPVFKDWFARSLLYLLLAATTYDNDKTFYLYDFTTYICIGLFAVATAYFIGYVTIELPKYLSYIHKQKNDETL